MGKEIVQPTLHADFHQVLFSVLHLIPILLWGWLKVNLFFYCHHAIAIPKALLIKLTYFTCTFEECWYLYIVWRILVTIFNIYKSSTTLKNFFVSLCSWTPALSPRKPLIFVSLCSLPLLEFHIMTQVICNLLCLFSFA